MRLQRDPRRQRDQNRNRALLQLAHPFGGSGDVSDRAMIENELVTLGPA